MRTLLRLSTLSVLLLAASCGGGGGGDDTGDDTPDGDADGDGISDEHEGAPSADTDGDGTPDWEDEDSDGDGIPDYREAGDGDLTTPPPDSDGDGTPDFRDTDSDDNGRPDGVDGLDDVDGDGVGDFADRDDDGDFLNDTVELGPDPADPVDSDGDGTPDFRDTDSDADTIPDERETSADYDEDGTPNYLDDDSDGDCIPDLAEAGAGEPPRDADGDNRPDFLDRDSDNDGLSDASEDPNCNGLQDAGESSATDDDTDGDGVSDLIEEAAGTDPLDAGDNPQANGDFVFVMPYEDAPTPMEDDLDFATDLVSVDVYVIVDRSGSMTGEITAVRNNLAAAIDGVQCPPLGTGDPATCIPDLWAGGGTIGYSGSSGQPYGNFRDLQPDPSFSALPITEPAGCCREPLTFGLWAAITGYGTAASGCSVATIPDRSTCVGSPANNAGYTGFGYPCFRSSALPVVLLATDEPPLSGGSDTLECPDWPTGVLPEYTARSARVIGITGSGVDADVTSDLETMATGTGAVDGANGNAPLVFDGSDANADDAIAEGIRTLAQGVPLDINALTTDDPADSVDSIAAFVDHLETLQLGTAQCADGLTDQDSNADGFDDYYVDVQAGTPVCWKVVVKQNTTVPPTTEPQLFRATVDVYGDGVTILDTRDVFFLVPPEQFDPPVD